jgi:hypothetical protein
VLKILEEAYLAILRVVVMPVAPLLLIAMVWFGVASHQPTSGEKEPAKQSSPCMVVSSVIDAYSEECTAESRKVNDGPMNQRIGRG